MKDQAPGFYRRMVGDAVVTAVSDGYIDLPLDVLQNIAPEEASAILTGRFRRPTPRSSINVFVVQAGGRTVLIDTGAGNGFGPSGGHMAANLAAAGIKPGDIDLVLMTHLHPDHCGGMATAEGAAVFPNAEVGLSEAEAGFWLGEAALANAPEAFRPYFVGAQAAVAPYQGRLRMDEAIAGIARVALPGHTPGHCGYRVGDGAEALLIVGDILHVPDVQAARPEVGVGFDIDGATAVASRRRALDMAVADRLLVAGMHMHFPAFSHVAKAGTGYEIVPETWVA